MKTGPFLIFFIWKVASSLDCICSISNGKSCLFFCIGNCHAMGWEYSPQSEPLTWAVISQCRITLFSSGPADLGNFHIPPSHSHFSDFCGRNPSRGLELKAIKTQSPNTLVLCALTIQGSWWQLITKLQPQGECGAVCLLISLCQLSGKFGRKIDLTNSLTH